MKKLILGLMMMVFAVSAEAEIVKEYTLNDSLTATLDDQGVLTINGSGAMPNWEMEAGQAWADERDLIKSVVGEGEISIGEYAFYRCRNLTSASFPNATSIGKRAFYYCELLESVSFPNATTIGESAFEPCSSLTNATLQSATTIGEAAFYDCSKLTEISLPNVTSIGAHAFSFCGNLTSVSFPNVTSIGTYAFSRCGNLTSVSFPNATTILRWTFYECSKLEKIIVNAPMAMVFKNDKETYHIPAGCKILPEYCVVVPHSAEHTTVKVYTDGAEVTCSPIVVASNAIAAVVFTAEWGYRFGDYTTVQTNTFMVVDDPTEVDGPEAIRNLVAVEPDPAERSTAKVYLDGVEVMGSPIEVLSNTTVEVVFTVVEEGYCFEDHTFAQTNTFTATDDPTEVDGPMVVKIPSLEEDVVRKAEWEVETTISVSTALKSGDKTLDKGEYEYACVFYGIEVKTEPTAEDYKFVPEGSVVVPEEQVIKSDEIAVKKESIQAAKAEAISVADGVVTLNVNVCSNGNFTAETSSWEKAKITDVKLNDDGTVTLTVPVDFASGFMILQSKDAKVQSDNNVPDIIIEDR